MRKLLAPAVLATSAAYSVFLSTPLGREPGGEYTNISRTFGSYGLAFIGAWLGSGVPVAPHLLKYLNQALETRTRVYYGEMSDRHLSLMVSHPVPSPFTSVKAPFSISRSVSPREGRSEWFRTRR